MDEIDDCHDDFCVTLGRIAHTPDEISQSVSALFHIEYSLLGEPLAQHLFQRVSADTGWANVEYTLLAVLAVPTRE